MKNTMSYKHYLTKFSAFFIAFSFSSIMTLPLIAHENQKGENEPEEHFDKHHQHPENHGKRKPHVEESVTTLWSKINTSKRHLHELIQSKKFDEVHEAEEALSKLLKKLPAVSQEFPDDKQKRVKGTLKNMDKLLDELHRAADESEAATAQEKMAVLDTLFTVLKAQYAPDVTAEEIMEDKRMKPPLHPEEHTHENHTEGHTKP